MLRRNFRALDHNTQVLLAKCGPFGQTNIEGAQRTIAVIFEFIGDVKMNAAGRRPGNKNLRLPIGKLIARAKGLDATRGEKCPSAEGGREKNAQP